jgi:hypothetical protein
MLQNPEKRAFTRFTVISQGAEYLVIEYLMRRNILTSKAPPTHEGYNLNCLHPNARVNGPQLRIQGKSRFATDCNRGFPVKGKTLDAFNYLVVVFLNVATLSPMQSHFRVGRDIASPSFTHCQRTSFANTTIQPVSGRRFAPVV